MLQIQLDGRGNRDRLLTHSTMSAIVWAWRRNASTDGFGSAEFLE